MTAIILLVWVLAVARLTRLVTRDKFPFEPFRKWVTERLGTGSRLTYLVHCTWCSSIWIAFATAPAVIVLAGVSWWWLPLLALAASQLTGWGTLLELDD
ncbi:hypothetical protein IU501_34795 [Nocardia otitidiscaviarum]|uniref:hypothetical protein n=1 Tax=Nocardia otitidiscaviarum TaxID=1823 RepID=UPI001893FD3F|nr:hypothetical protein [Nocardia otitidiscaviarum]MBF6138140.1 hypothetical protein [Nocardia otitidiscaviarum]